MDIRVLTEEDVEAFFALRLEGLRHDPLAFGRSAQEWLARPLDSVRAQLKPRESSFTLGAFIQDELAGIMGLVRNEGEKERHKAWVYGVYVTPKARGKGIAKALLLELLSRARKLEGLEQISLAVGAGQLAARQLYRSQGFEVWGYEKHALKVGQQYVDEEHMVLWL